MSVITKGKKGPAPNEKSEKSEKEAQVVRPVSPSRAARKRARYEDDDDYEDTSHARSTPSKAIKKDNGKMPDDSKTAKPTSTGPKLPSFKKVTKLPNVTEKHALPSPSKSESPDLRSDSEEDSSNPILAKQASSAMATPYTSNSREQQSVAMSPSPRRSPRMQNDSYQVPHSTRPKRDLEDIPLVADMDSDDDEEESVYVLSSRMPSTRADKARKYSKTAMTKSRPVF